MVHIKSAHDELKAWCETTLGTDFHFKTVDAAVLNGLHDRKPIVCRACTQVVISYLMVGQVDIDQQNNKDIMAAEGKHD